MKKYWMIIDEYGVIVKTPAVYHALEEAISRAEGLARDGIMNYKIVQVVGEMSRAAPVWQEYK